MLRVSPARVRQLAQEGLLRPTVGPGGTKVYDTKAVQEFAEGYRPKRRAGRRDGAEDGHDVDGERAAKCFDMFAERASLQAIVRTLRLSPRTVRSLYKEWQTSLDDGAAAELADKRARDLAKVMKETDKAAARDIRHQQRLAIVREQSRGAILAARAGGKAAARWTPPSEPKSPAPRARSEEPRSPVLEGIARGAADIATALAGGPPSRSAPGPTPEQQAAAIAKFNAQTAHLDPK